MSGIFQVLQKKFLFTLSSQVRECKLLKCIRVCILCSVGNFFDWNYYSAV